MYWTMALENPRLDVPTAGPRAGQVVLSAATEDRIPSDRARSLYRLSDPRLSELGLDEFLDELLVRVRRALWVDTVAILLLDVEAQQLVARAAKGIEEEVEQGVRIPIGQGFAGRIAAERVAIFIADVDHADILNPILREKGIRSLLGVPLIVEGDLIGVLHVGSLKPRMFGPVDVAVLQVAAARAAPGIERARLFSALEHEHRVAMLLQRSLLPRRLVDVMGVSTAARYLPASDEVGGDWYDVFELQQGQLGIAIGDVVGHGVKAAALMGQLSTALHAYAIEGHSPGRTLALVDRFLDAMSGYEIATAAYAVLDPESGALRLASAGHLPPIVVGGGTARVIELAPAPPLGAFPYGRCQEHEMSLAPGETLVFYTDGLVERPEDRADAEHRRACRRCSRGVVGRGSMPARREGTRCSQRVARRRRDRRNATQRHSSRVVYAAACRSAGARRRPAHLASVAAQPGRGRPGHGADHALCQRGVHKRDRARVFAGACRV